MFKDLTWHELIAGIAALMSVGAVIALSVMGEAVPSQLETLGAVALTYVFGTEAGKRAA